MIYPVFVYGTLHPESPHYNQWLVEDELDIHEWHPVTTKGTRVPDPHCPWDLVWYDGSDKVIEGAILVLKDEAQLRRLDRYEGYDERRTCNLFVRKQIEVLTPNNETLQAWGYEWGTDQAEELERLERQKAYVTAQ